MASKFICPSCKREGLCSCDTCKEQKEEGFEFVLIKDETIVCPYCGNEFTYDQALNEEIKILRNGFEV